MTANVQIGSNLKQQVFRKLPPDASVVLTVDGIQRTQAFAEFSREYLSAMNDTDYALLQEGCLQGNHVPVGCNDPETPLGILRLA